MMLAAGAGRGILAGARPRAVALHGWRSFGIRQRRLRAACHAAQCLQRAGEGQWVDRTQASAGEPTMASGRSTSSGAGRMAALGPARHRHRLASLGRSG